eukprot:TRINITY_DN10910_c0_g3_i2.p1 TRINITY_DN10910_c0_g3~~TRINITY_DN10910_c0_g3_i2.p1  ORF type:complete len:489 (-),score=137.28 TRINITY_DN10910_c0_g3_i2:290-1756(-)
MSRGIGRSSWFDPLAPADQILLFAAMEGAVAAVAQEFATLGAEVAKRLQAVAEEGARNSLEMRERAVEAREQAVAKREQDLELRERDFELRQREAVDASKPSAIPGLKALAGIEALPSPVRANCRTPLRSAGGSTPGGIMAASPKRVQFSEAPSANREEEEHESIILATPPLATLKAAAKAQADAAPAPAPAPVEEAAVSAVAAAPPSPQIATESLGSASKLRALFETKTRESGRAAPTPPSSLLRRNTWTSPAFVAKEAAAAPSGSPDASPPLPAAPAPSPATGAASATSGLLTAPAQQHLGGDAAVARAPLPAARPMTSSERPGARRTAADWGLQISASREAAREQGGAVAEGAPAPESPQLSTRSMGSASKLRQLFERTATPPVNGSGARSASAASAAGRRNTWAQQMQAPQGAGSGGIVVRTLAEEFQHVASAPALAPAPAPTAVVAGSVERQGSTGSCAAPRVPRRKMTMDELLRKDEERLMQ